MSGYAFLRASVKSLDDVGTGGWTAVVSAPTVDRDDEVVEAHAFDPLPPTVPVRSAHFGGELVGSGRPYYAGSDLYLAGKFASTSKAQEVRALVREGHLASMSVMFLPLGDRAVDGRKHITKGELLAVDWAEIPSNRDARVLAVRAMGASPSPAVFRARIAAIEAELLVLDLDSKGRAGSLSLDQIYAEIANTHRFLEKLDRR